MSLKMGPVIQAENARGGRDQSFRVGIVRQQDAANARVRVEFPEFDRMLSYWLPVLVCKSQNDKMYWMPDVGEQVVCLMDERDEAGAVLGAIYSSVDRPPVSSVDKYHLSFSDGAHFEYDRSAHVTELAFDDSTIIKYDASAHALSIEFSDGTAIAYRAAVHALSITGGEAAAVIVAAPAGIVLQAGDSQVSIMPSGVSINPPIPLSSTVAQT